MKLAICSATITAKNLRAMTSLQQKHKALDDEMVRRHNRFLSGPVATGQYMIKSGHPLADQLQDRVRVVQGKWAMLKEEAAENLQQMHISSSLTAMRLTLISLLPSLRLVRTLLRLLVTVLIF